MEIFMLEYYKEVEYDDFYAEEYNLIGVYFTENDAQIAKANFAAKRNINKKYLFVSATKIGKTQWEGGFITV